MNYTAAWIIWLVLFAAIEGAAIVDKAPNDTLSEHVWKWFAVRDKSKGWLARRGALAVFLGWLSLHFLTGGLV